MPEISIPNGVSRGTSPFDRPGRWYDSNFIRFRDGRVLPIGGWERITPTPLDSTPRKLLAIRDNDDIRRFMFGCQSEIYVLEGDTITDVSPSDLDGLDTGDSIPAGYGIGPYGSEAFGTERTEGDPEFLRAGYISLASWGEDVLCLYSSDGRLLEWSADAPTTDFSPVEDVTSTEETPVYAPTARAMVVTPERHVLLIGSGNPRTVRWCEQEDYSVWTSTPTNTAGDLTLESNGLLVAGISVRDGTLVFSDSDLWLIRYLGPPFIYGRERIAESISLISPNAIARFGSGVVWMAKDGSIWSYDSGVVRPVPCDVADFIKPSELTGITKTHASGNGLHPEVMFFFPTDGNLECNKYVIWNYAEGTWAVGEMARSTMLSAGVHGYPLAGGSDGHVYQHEAGWLDAGLTRVGRVWIETGGVGGQNSNAILRVEADGDGDSVGGTEVTIYGRHARDGDDTTFGPYLADSAGWTPTRAGARHLRVRFEATADGTWSVGKPIIDVKPVGNR